MPRGSSPPPPSPHTSCCSLSGGNRVGAIPQQHYLCSHIPSSSDTITMPPPLQSLGSAATPARCPHLPQSPASLRRLLLYCPLIPVPSSWPLHFSVPQLPHL